MDTEQLNLVEQWMRKLILFCLISVETPGKNQVIMNNKSIKYENILINMFSPLPPIFDPELCALVP